METENVVEEVGAAVGEVVTSTTGGFSVGSALVGAGASAVLVGAGVWLYNRIRRKKVDKYISDELQKDDFDDYNLDVDDATIEE